MASAGQRKSSCLSPPAASTTKSSGEGHAAVAGVGIHLAMVNVDVHRITKKFIITTAHTTEVVAL